MIGRYTDYHPSRNNERKRVSFIMSIEEAIAWIEEHFKPSPLHIYDIPSGDTWLYETEQDKALAIAIGCMRKQIPMKMPGTHTDYKCSLCGRRIRSGKGSSSFTRDNYCQRCGQKIDWD